MTTLDRRALIRRTVAGAAVAAAWTAPLSRAAQPSSGEPFGYCLNTSTIRGQNLGIVAEVEIAARAGYTGIEPWIRELEQFVQQGGMLADLRKQIADSGLTVESAIGFANWIGNDATARQAGLEQAKREMEMVRAIGGSRIAAPPAGGTQEVIDLWQAARRYAALLEAGQAIGVTPQVELWGFSKSLSRLGETLFVAAESGHPSACILLDVYHLYKGGSDFHGLRLLGPRTMFVIHMNDYPADPPRDKIADAQRVFPGDGVAPLSQILCDLAASGFRGALSLELFNKEYWNRDALEVARIGLDKMRIAVRKSLEAKEG
jgi:sugar phosphate isomerase/epimerase